MRFERTSDDFTGKHATLAPSNYAWMNYDLEKLEKQFRTAQAVKRGTEEHAFAAEAIRLKKRMPENTETLNLYINDAIGFRMEPELLLYYSDDAYGHPDAICFRKERVEDEKPMLRIHDLKTGLLDGSVMQLVGYAALFCLQYAQNPFEMDMEFRIYQHDSFTPFIGDADEITHVMDTIRTFSKALAKWRMEAE